MRGEKNFLEREVSRFTSELDGMKARGANIFKTFFTAFYLRYLMLQRSSSTKKNEKSFSPDLYQKYNGGMIRFWSILGPTTNRSLLIFCALIENTEVFLWIVFVILNLWCMVCYILQRRVHGQMITEE